MLAALPLSPSCRGAALRFWCDRRPGGRPGGVPILAPALSPTLLSTGSQHAAHVKPLFLLGPPRSGTTFLQQVVGAHPEILVTDELRIVSWLVREAHRLREGHAEHGVPYPVNHGPEFADYLLNNANWIISAFYRSQAKRSGKPVIKYWGDKYPHYDEVLELIPKLFPGSRFVVIHRDLRDVVCSLRAGHEWTTARAVPYACLIFGRLIRKIEALVTGGVVPAEHFVHVDYLDFHNRVDQEAGRIFASLSLDYPSDTAERVRELRSIQSHSIRRSEQTPRKFNIEGSQSRWERELSPADLDTVLNGAAGIAQEIALANRLKPGEPFVYPPPTHIEPAPGAEPA